MARAAGTASVLKTGKIKQVWLDPEGLWLVDTNLSNNSYSRLGPGIRILSVTANLLWLVQNVLVTCFSWL